MVISLLGRRHALTFHISIQCLCQSWKIVVMVQIACTVLQGAFARRFNSVSIEEIYAAFQCPDRKLSRRCKTPAAMSGQRIQAEWCTVDCRRNIQVYSRQYCKCSLKIS